MTCDAEILARPAAISLPALGVEAHWPEVLPAARPEPPRAAAPTIWRATGLEEPVFLDRTGYRRPLMRSLAAVTASLCAGWLGMLVAGGVGFAGLPSTPAESGSAASALLAPPPVSPYQLIVEPTLHRHGVVLVADRPDRLAEHHRRSAAHLSG